MTKETYNEKYNNGKMCDEIDRKEAHSILT